MSAREGPSRDPQVAVIGAATDDPELAEPALEVGRGLARAGVTVVCGGLTGVMEAAARGARGEGGTVIGIVPHDSPAAANRWCTHVIATGIGHARNLAVVASGDAVIAIGGEWGTLSEIAFARELGRPVAALDSWQLRGRGELERAPGVVVVSDPREAVESALEAVGRD